MKRLVICGAGGYGQEIAWLVEDINAAAAEWIILGYVDDDEAKRGTALYDRPVLGSIETASSTIGSQADVFFAIGIGQPGTRRTVAQRIAAATGWTPAVLVHPTAVVGRHVQLDPGAIVGAGCIVGPHATLGPHSAVNVGAGIGHNALLGAYCMVGPGARVSGGCHIADGVLIGSNAVIAPEVVIGRDAVVGALSFVVRSVSERQTAYGNPARTFYAGGARS